MHVKTAEIQIKYCTTVNFPVLITVLQLCQVLFLREEWCKGYMGTLYCFATYMLV